MKHRRHTWEDITTFVLYNYANTRDDVLESLKEARDKHDKQTIAEAIRGIQEYCGDLLDDLYPKEEVS